jgi:hypothetical protein
MFRCLRSNVLARSYLIGGSKYTCSPVGRVIHQGSHFATAPLPQYDEEELRAARSWLADFTVDTIPRSVGDVSFSRSSGPGGQNVNK